MANRVHSSCWNCSRMWRGVTTRIFSPRPRRISSRQDHPDLEGLAQPDRVGDEQPGAETGEGLVDRPVLVVERVEQLAGGRRPGRSRLAGTGVLRINASR